MRNFIIKKQVTNREEISLDKYLQEIGRVKLLTTDEEVELGKKVRNGDKTALETLVNANLRFVITVAKQYQNQGLSLPDLINEGNLGLIKAAQRFDETRGFKFISYSVWWIRQSIQQALDEKARIVKLPSNRLRLITQINRTVSRLEQENHIEPSHEQVASLLKIPPDSVEEVIMSSLLSISLDAPFNNEGEHSNLYDVLFNDESLRPDMNLDIKSLHYEVEQVLSTLRDTEAAIIRFYFGLGGHEPHSLNEIACKIGLTRERIRQIKEKALIKMRAKFYTKLHRTILL